MGWKVDIVLTHTTPLKYEPVETFLPGIEQSNVDKSTEEWLDTIEDRLATYALRSQTIERVFADAKEKHAMRYTPYRGLPAVTAWVKLKFTALNLKKSPSTSGCACLFLRFFT